MNSFKQPQAQGELVAVQLAKDDAERLRKAAERNGMTVREYATAAIVEKLSMEFGRPKTYGPDFDLEGSVMVDTEFDSDEVRIALEESHKAAIEHQRRIKSS